MTQTALEPTPACAAASQAAPLRIVVAAPNRRWARRAEPFRHVVAGLKRLGHDVEVVAPVSWPLCSRRPDAAFLWNGAKGRSEQLAEKFRQDGVKTMIMERGFFDRFNHTQIDRQGFNHNASWADGILAKAPPEGGRRLAAVWGRTKSVRRRDKGYILVLLQTPGDAQLADGEISHPAPLVGAVEDAAPQGLEIRVRTHPLSHWSCDARSPAKMIGDLLKDAIAGARFCVTINSGAGNEALAWGCPVLCLGPALYAMAGAAMQTHLSNLSGSIEWMLDGAEFDSTSVRNYLHHLACRQWSCAELANGAILQRLLDDA